MNIANPIYDIVFKYMLEDSKVAKLLLSAIIGEKIVKLELRPQERTLETKKQSLTVYRLDFSARIKTKDGKHKNILIEIQKAKFSADIMRFRQYLGQEYSDKENTYKEKVKKEVEPKKKKKKKAKKKGYPIVTLYFLGYALDKATAPVIHVKRNYIDVTTGEIIEEKEDFIESLTHDSFIIQIPYLKAKRQSELLTLLSVFDQSLTAPRDSHLLSIQEEDFPKKYHSVIRRLQRAVAEEELRDVMDLEDEILEELADKEREVFEAIEELEESKQVIVEKDHVIEENKQALEKKDQALEEKDQVIEENKQALEEKDLELEQQKKEIEALRKKINEEL